MNRYDPKGSSSPMFSATLTHRMRVFAFTAALLLLGVLALPSARADATGEARKAIQAAYDKMNAALARKDVKGAFTVLTPDVEQITLDGRKFDAAQMRQQMTQALAAAKSVKSQTTVQKLTLKGGSTAQVLVRSRVAIVLTDPQTNKPITFVGEETSQDTWIKTARGWLGKRSKTLSKKETVNGRPMPTS